MTNWSKWTDCRCGYADKKSRTRSVKTTAVAEGQTCLHTKETGTCTMVPCNCAKIRPGHYGDRCEHRDCKLSQWSSWTKCKGCPGIDCTFTDCPTLHRKKYRKRHVMVSKVGGGKQCGALKQSNSCGYKCVQYCTILGDCAYKKE